MKVSRRDLTQHVGVERLVRDHVLHPSILDLGFHEPFRIFGFHAAVLGEPAVPRRVGDIKVSVYVVEFLARPKYLVALSQLADEPARRAPLEMRADPTTEELSAVGSIRLHEQGDSDKKYS